ncbi:MAG: site-specific integrase [Brevibacterium sp.]|nr:site-specific integrase [Brevibacterium sp.]
MEHSVAELGTIVITALREADYQESTITNYQKTLGRLTEYIDAHGGVYTPQLGTKFAGLTTSPRTGKFSAQRRFDFSRLIHLFNTYLDTGTIVLSPRKLGGGGRWPTSLDLVERYTAYEIHMSDRGLADATIEAYGRATRSYLVFLEDQSTTTLDAATADTVTGHFDALLARWKTTSFPWVVSNLRPFFKYSHRPDLIDALTLINATRNHAVIPALTDDQCQQLVAECEKSSTPARNAAITLLALTTGLRAIDITRMTLSDLDWHHRTLRIVQHKTGHPLTVPLPNLVCQRLADYVLHHRPASTSHEVFLRTKAPHTRLTDHAAIHVIITKTLNAAGIDRPAGTQFLRHTAATRLLQAQTPLPTISAVLGHRDQASTAVYYTVDTERLRNCVLPVPKGAQS